MPKGTVAFNANTASLNAVNVANATATQQGTQATSQQTIIPAEEALQSYRCGRRDASQYEVLEANVHYLEWIVKITR